MNPLTGFLVHDVKKQQESVPLADASSRNAASQRTFEILAASPTQVSLEYGPTNLARRLGSLAADSRNAPWRTRRTV